MSGKLKDKILLNEDLLKQLIELNTAMQGGRLADQALVTAVIAVMLRNDVVDRQELRARFEERYADLAATLDDKLKHHGARRDRIRVHMEQGREGILALLDPSRREPTLN